MKNISNKIIASFLMIAMVMAMIMPTMVLATEDKETDKDVINPEVPTEPTEEEPAGESGEEVEGQLTDISQVSLNRKIQFTGMLYKTEIFKTNILSLVTGEENNTETTYTEAAEYKDQIALVTDVLLRKDEGMIGVAFIEEGKKLPTMGYIKFAECTVVEIGKYITYDFNFEDGANLVIEIEGENYPVTSNTNVQMVNGGIQIGEDVILLKEGQEINLVNVNGGFTLDLQNMSGTANGSASVYNDLINVNGDATLKIIKNGVEVSGDASVNNKELAGGTAQVTLEPGTENIVNVEITNASVMSNDVTAFANQIIQTLIGLIKKIITSIFTSLATMAF